MGSSGAIRARPHPSAIYGFGHSGIAGATGPSRYSNAWLPRLAALLGAREFNYGVNAEYLMLVNDTGITTRVHQLLVPPGSPAVSKTGGSGEYKAPAQIVCIYGGAVDLASQAVNDAGLSAISNGLRACIVRARMGARFPNSDSSVVFSQGTGASNWFGSGSTLLDGTTATQDASNGNFFTINVPASYPGTEINVGFTVPSSGGAVYQRTLDGGALADVDHRGGTVFAGVFEPRVWRVASSASGTHTLVGTVTLRQGNGDYLNYWGWASPNPPLVVVLGHPRMPAYPTNNHTITDADVLAMNTLIANVVAEFDSRVVYVDLDAAIGQNANLAYTDGQHLNDAGQTEALRAVYNAIVNRYPPDLTVIDAAPRDTGVHQAFRIHEDSTTTGAKDNRSGAATLVAGTKTVTNRIVKTTSRIFLTRSTTGGTPGHLSYTISGGASFTINSSSNTDTSTINWWIVEPG